MGDPNEVVLDWTTGSTLSSFVLDYRYGWVQVID